VLANLGLHISCACLCTIVQRLSTLFKGQESVEASKAQKSALSSILSRLDDAAAVIEDLQRQLKRTNQRIDDMSSETTDQFRKMGYEFASLRGTVAANTRWGEKPTEKRVFLSEAELALARTIGLTEKQFAEQKTIAESLGVDIEGLIKKQQQKKSLGG